MSLLTSSKSSEQVVAPDQRSYPIREDRERDELDRITLGADESQAFHQPHELVEHISDNGTEDGTEDNGV